MNYTKQLPEELKKLGFTFSYNHADSELNYDVYKTENIEVTLDHTNESVLLNIDFNDEPINVESLEHLIRLQAMIKSITVLNHSIQH